MVRATLSWCNFSWCNLQPELWCTHSTHKVDLILWIIEILHDLISPNCRNYASMAYTGSCRIVTINNSTHKLDLMVPINRACCMCFIYIYIYVYCFILPLLVPQRFRLYRSLPHGLEVCAVGAGWSPPIRGENASSWGSSAWRTKTLPPARCTRYSHAYDVSAAGAHVPKNLAIMVIWYMNCRIMRGFYHVQHGPQLPPRPSILKPLPNLKPCSDPTQASNLGGERVV